MAHEERLRHELSDRYGIERELGRGGMAIVYLARDHRHSREVALKVLNPDLATAAFTERFFREIKVAARLVHPNILPLLDSGQAAGCLYYVTPFLAGESLRSWLDRESQLSVETATRIAGEVADALDYAHRQGVVHRDIKPGNILISDGHAIVADFGIATALATDVDHSLTAPGAVLGTLQYMSPEQAIGEAVDGRSDIYSLAAMLYETLVGNPPNRLLARSGSSSRPSEGILHRLSERRSVPPYLAAAIERGLAFAPADRPSRADEFKRAILGNRPASRWRLRQREILWAAGGIVVAAAGILISRRTSLPEPGHISSVSPADSSTPASGALRVLEAHPTPGTFLSIAQLRRGVPLTIAVEHRVESVPRGKNATLILLASFPCEGPPVAPTSSCWAVLPITEASTEPTQLGAEVVLRRGNIVRDTIFVRVTLAVLDSAGGPKNLRGLASTLLIYPVGVDH